MIRRNQAFEDLGAKHSKQREQQVQGPKVGTSLACSRNGNEVWEAGERDRRNQGHAGHGGQSASEVFWDPLKSCVCFLF